MHQVTGVVVRDTDPVLLRRRAHPHLVQELEDALESNLAVLTPHLTKPIDNSYRPPERVIRMCGTYKLK